jgi:MoaA/NifB/PqqE/SkfB family radical SAM enzyme
MLMGALQGLRYRPFLSQLVVTPVCNLACGYCNEYVRRGAPVPLPALTERLRKLHDLGTIMLEITGGEPLTHPQVYDVVAASRRLGMYTAMISNAFLLNERRVRALNTAGLQELQVSVDAVEPTPVTVKVLRVLRPKLEALARAARFKVVMSAVVGAAPPAEVLEVVRFAKSHGFRPRVLYLHDHGGQLQLRHEELALSHAIAREIGTRFKEGEDYRTRLASGGGAPFKCRAGSRYLYVDAGGVVRWCSQTRDAFGIPLARYDRQELRRQFETQKPCNVRCTVGCARHASSVDWWRPQPRPAAS